MNELGSGILMTCNEEGKITKVIFNNISPKLNSVEGKMFPELFSNEKIGGAIDFLMEIKKHRASFSKEMFFSKEYSEDPLYFNGIKNAEEITILVSRHRIDLIKLLTDFMLMNNEQINIIRALVKNEQDYKSGSRKSEELYFNELTKLNNELVGMHREMAKKNRELEELNKLKNQFLGMAAHDLRNPLGQIYNICEILEEEVGPACGEALNFLEMAKSRAVFMMNLLNELLDVSAIEAGEIKINKNPVDIISIIGNIIRLNNYLAVKKSITINFRKPDRPVVIAIDEVKIGQVIANYITNAIKYSYSNSVILIEAKTEGEEFIFSIKDEGQGINEKELHLLFKPFQKTSAKSTANESSTGLGLFIVKKIIDAHKGRVWAESEPGRGSTFYFSIPL